MNQMTKSDLEKALASSVARSQELQCEIAALKDLLRKQDSEKSDLLIKLQAATAPIRNDTYNEAVRAYGKQSQLIMAMEEMAELTKELSKNTRGSHNTDAISEEIADVEIMLEQLKIIYGNRAAVDCVKCAKLDRLAVRLTDGLY